MRQKIRSAVLDIWGEEILIRVGSERQKLGIWTEPYLYEQSLFRLPKQSLKVNPVTARLLREDAVIAVVKQGRGGTTAL